ncbi:MAG: GNAT family N-acetyltransferase [Caulobacter sp.]|nr:GNAT family N-acetyltransferase [Caulobacter sp.]
MDGDTSEVLIRPAASQADYDAFGRVCRQYVDWCRARYADMGWFVEEAFGHQSLDAELAVLSEKYGPPNGLTLIALRGGQVVASGAWRRTSDGVCELKRLYVTDAARGLGLGRRLSQALIATARDAGFRTMQLDTARRLIEAIAMYRSMGFAEIAPYHAYPEHLMPELVFMETSLREA